MPKSTFFNLPEEKKNRIIEAAYGEFIENRYENVTISQIAKSARIPVGSFYQYFYDKDDLYLYLFFEIDLRANMLCETYEMNYFELQELSYIKDHFTEQELKFYDTWYYVPDDVMRKFYFGEYDDRLFEICRRSIEKFRDQGKLEDYGNLELVLYVYVTSTFNLYMYCKKNHIDDERERLELKNLLFSKILGRGIFKEK